MRYSHFPSNIPSQNEKEALHTLKTLAVTDTLSLVPLRCDAFFTDLFTAIGRLIDGDLRLPVFPMRYILGKEEGIAAVFSLVYAAFRKRVENCTFSAEERGEEIVLIAEGRARTAKCGTRPSFSCEEMPDSLLRRVARESGFSFALTEGECLSLTFRFRRFRAEVQIVHAHDDVRTYRMMEMLRRMLPLVPKAESLLEKAFL